MGGIRQRRPDMRERGRRASKIQREKGQGRIRPEEKEGRDSVALRWSGGRARIVRRVRA